MDQGVLIIGYGSGIRGDDSLGPKAAALLEERLATSRDVTVLSRASLTPELAANVADASLAVFIDCAATGPVGRVVQRDVSIADDSTVAMVHFLDPSGLLYWSKQLFGRAPRAVTLSVAGESFDIGDDLTPIMEKALPVLVERAVSVVDEHLGACHA